MDLLHKLVVGILKKPNEVCIIAFWKNKESLQNFMNHLHDVIFLDNQQITTYADIQIKYFNSLLNMDGTSKNIGEAIQKSNFIRIADYLVNENKIHHFEEAQKSIWIPSMKKTKGMLGGKFSINEQNKNNYLVSTFWDSKKIIKTILKINYLQIKNLQILVVIYKLSTEKLLPLKKNGMYLKLQLHFKLLT